MKEYKIKTLLDINNFTGETEGRVLPYVKWIFVGAIPVFSYYGFIAGFIRIPFLIGFIFELLWLFRFYLLIVLNESKRVEQYKRQYAGEYTKIGDIITCEVVEDFLSYNNGLCSYFIVVSNNYSNDDLVRAKQVEKFLDTLGKFTIVDIYVQSMSIADVIRKKVENSNVFKDKGMLDAYIQMMKCNMHIADESSTLTRTVFEVRGRTTDYKQLKDVIVKAFNNDSIKVYRDVILADGDLIKDVVSRDLDTFVDFEDIDTNKYATGKYHGSRVVAYDEDVVVEDKSNIVEDVDARRFIAHE